MITRYYVIYSNGMPGMPTVNRMAAYTVAAAMQGQFMMLIREHYPVAVVKVVVNPFRQRPAPELSAYEVQEGGAIKLNVNNHNIL